MVKDEYYYVWDDNYSGFMIGKCLGSIKVESQFHRCDAILISTFESKKSFGTEGWCYKDTKRYYREATQDEIDWLELCIAENRFVEKPKQKIYELW
jgi:hypothetical protein